MTPQERASALVHELHRQDKITGYAAGAVEAVASAIEQAQQEALEDACKLECKWCALGRPADPAVYGEWIHHSLTANRDEWEWCQAGRIRHLMARQETANG